MSKKETFFARPVDKRNRRAMIDFLSNHFRYYSMSSVNRVTSYAHCVKVHRLGIPVDLMDTAYDLVGVDETYRRLRHRMDQWAKQWNYRWQVGFNGQQGGYLVLYEGHAEPSEYRSYCPACGQRNFRLVSDAYAQCGVCGEQRVNYTIPPQKIVTYSGRGTDYGEDFEDWELQSLRDRVELVQEFDRFCDDLRHTFLCLCLNYAVVNKTIMVPQSIKVLEQRGA